MLWDELHRFWTEKTRIDTPEPFRREHVLLPDDVRERLERVARVEAQCPDVGELVAQVPDVVGWLRDRMVGRPQLGEGGRPSGKAQSKPPFRIAFMAAADREVAALAHWCSAVGVETTCHMWRWPDGRVRGVAPNDLSGVFDLVDKFTRYLASDGVPEGVLSDPKFGLWTVRSQHYRLWPELAAFLQTAETEVAAEVEEEVLF